MTDSYQQVIKAHGPAIARAIASYARPGSARDDLSQEVALALITALPRFRADGSLRAFVLRVAHQVCLRQVIRDRKEVADLPDLVSNALPADEVASSAQERNRLMTAIRALPLTYRQTLVLALEDLSHREIANALGISENAVGIRIHRAKSLLKQELGECNG
jgi:RNA polymerase sigma-70 factor (ECF subfamily)